ncbi:hypothetical protein [Bacteroides acidifaciens]|uniref:hypothetical protein n=1 Tax=Bacteroides acidifaciens TaxID=85831 RepID=UPI0025768162|nr:hypothetical protein [Bacteroides acidifaciens]
MRKILPETASPPDLASAVNAIRYLCIRQRKQATDGRDFNYTIGCYLCYRKRTA